MYLGGAWEPVGMDVYVRVCVYIYVCMCVCVCVCACVYNNRSNTKPSQHNAQVCLKPHGKNGYQGNDSSTRQSPPTQASLKPSA